MNAHTDEERLARHREDARASVQQFYASDTPEENAARLEQHAIGRARFEVEERRHLSFELSQVAFFLDVVLRNVREIESRTGTPLTQMTAGEYLGRARERCDNFKFCLEEAERARKLVRAVESVAADVIMRAFWPAPKQQRRRKKVA